MRLVLAAALTLLSAFPARAACEGQNQIALLPEATRAELTARVGAVPYPRGNLWRATRGDQVIHLLGTYHLDDPRHGPLMDRVAPLIDGADTVLVEAGPEEEAALQADLARDPSLMFIMDGPTLPERLAPETWAALKDALRDRSIPPFMGAKMQPAYLAMLLGLPGCALEAAEAGAKGLDARVVARAMAQDIPVRALEPHDTLFRVFSGLTEQQQEEMLTLTLAISGQAEDSLVTMADSYFAGDSRMTWEFSRWQALQAPGINAARIEADFAEMEELLMNARNRAWIPVIEQAATGGSVFAAFGALHLSGQEGMLALMEQNGFALERLDD